MNSEGRTPAQEREFQIYYARVLLREASARRNQFASRNSFYWLLFHGAQNARSKAAAIDVRPAPGRVARPVRASASIRLVLPEPGPPVTTTPVMRRASPPSCS